MMADIAKELKEHNITAVSFWPGAVATELVTDVFLTAEDQVSFF